MGFGDHLHMTCAHMKERNPPLNLIATHCTLLSISYKICKLQCGPLILNSMGWYLLCNQKISQVHLVWDELNNVGLNIYHIWCNRIIFLSYVGAYTMWCGCVCVVHV